jgi:alkyl hydroperoxide reductase subunit F
MSQNHHVYELIIIGAGPAGITAAIYAARKKMDLLVITKSIGGQVTISSQIENYMGFQYITGEDLPRKKGRVCRRRFEKLSNQNFR